MRASEIIESLAALPGRGAGTDAERRAALHLIPEICQGGRAAEIETFWCRPNWAAAQAWHVALGVAGSLLAVGHPKLGAGLILLAVLSVIADATFGISPGRRLTPERASQNVVSPAPPRPPRPGGPGGPAPGVRLLITANLDAGRQGLVYRESVRARVARLRAITGGGSPGWAGWLTIALVWLLVVALIRVQGSRGAAVSVAQLVPTVGLVIALALLLDLASADWAPAAGDNGSGVAVAIALARALDAAPPAEAAVELVLTGAGDAQGAGLKRYLRAHRESHRATGTIVLGIAACGAGTPHWWRSDGPLVPRGFFATLQKLCAEVAALEPALELHEHRGRGSSPALPARQARIPAIAIGALDGDGVVPRSHRPSDTPAALDPGALDATLRTGLLLADAIDGYLAGVRPA